MENRDLGLRIIFQKILIAFLSKKFKLDYFRINSNLVSIAQEFILESFFVGGRPGKRKLLKAVKKINLDSISDNKFFYDTDIEYSFMLL